MDLDLLRGFALLGIALVNIPFFGQPLAWSSPEWIPVDRPADQMLHTLSVLLLQGQFITLFSFLFGLGFYLFAERIRERGGSLRSLYGRRLLILGTLGLLHGLFLWSGDILLTYAVSGLFLFFFVNRKPKTLLIWAGALVLSQWLFYTGFVVILQLGMQDPEFQKFWIQQTMEAWEEWHRLITDSLAAYGSGTFMDRLDVRLREIALLWEYLLFFGSGLSYIFALFLLGVCAGKQGWIQRLPKELPHLMGAPFFLLLGIGLVGSYLKRWASEHANWHTPDHLTSLYALLDITTTPLLSAAYTLLILHCWRKTADLPLWNWIADGGRASLSLYLGQSLLFTSIFYGYGLGLYGQLPMPQMLIIAVGGYAILLAFLHFYLRRFRRGPMESISRRFIYGPSPSS